MDALHSPDAAASSPRHAIRRRKTDEKIVNAVLTLMRRSGPTEVTIDAVAAESGVAKTTIYRRYTDRFELISGVAKQLSTRSIDAQDYTRAGLTGLIHDLKEFFEERLGLTAIGTLLVHDDAFCREWRESVVTPHLDTLRQYFVRGVEAGTFADDVDYELIVETVIGGMVACAAIRGAVPDDWVGRVVEMAWRLIRPAESTSFTPASLPGSSVVPSTAGQ